MCETTDWSVISCSVEEHQEICIMELMKMWIDSFLNEMEGPPCVINPSIVCYISILPGSVKSVISIEFHYLDNLRS